MLQIPIEHSRLLIETLSSVLHDDSDPLVKARAPEEIDEIGVNVFDLLVYLYIQSYKRLLPKGHKDSAAVADVWPSTSAFDGFLSVLSPLQVMNFPIFRFIEYFWVDRATFVGFTNNVLECSSYQLFSHFKCSKSKGNPFSVVRAYFYCIIIASKHGSTIADGA